MSTSRARATRKASLVTPRARPFLKWAGGKRQLLPELRRFIPARFDAYFEPFAGSAALFFDLWTSGQLHGRPVTLTDDNGDLIGCYRALARDVDAVVAALGALATGHARDPLAHFYKVRDGQFNVVRRRLGASGASLYPPDLAAMFIYLNRTGFNGLFRLNAAGDFNVPAGRYTRPRICDEANLRAVAAALASPNVQVRHEPFEHVSRYARSGDLVYFDPPYAPLNSTARFTSYTAGGFSDADQRRLQALVVELASRGCHVLLSNSTAPLITDLYVDNPLSRQVGLCAHVIACRRAINSNPARRGEVSEYLITNVPRVTPVDSRVFSTRL